MIRVYITGRARDGLYPYRIEGHDSYGGTPIFGRYSHEPLLDACRVLASLREPADHLVGLFHEGEQTWLMRTSVGYGSRHMVVGAPERPRVVPFAEPTDAPTATPEEPPPPPSTPPGLLADTGPATPAPASPGKSRHRHRQGGSGARRGSR
jgi:hypothetical protein